MELYCTNGAHDMKRPRFSLGTMLIACALIALATTGMMAWMRWPKNTAEAFIAALEARDSSRIQRFVDKEMTKHPLGFRKLGTPKGKVHLHNEPRSIANTLTSKQSFLMSGYDGAHRFDVRRGKVFDVEYTFFSNGIEFRR